MNGPRAPQSRLVLVTGPSGAGRSTAINVLEDLGFEAIDNLPLRLVPRLLDGDSVDRPIALGIDARNRDFSTSAMLEMVDQLAGFADARPAVLYLDCRPDVLLRRFSETRRRHPLAHAESPETGVRRELELLAPIRDRADALIDTSDLNVHELRDKIEALFASGTQGQLAVTIQSFSYKRGLPPSADIVFDCRFLKNPYWQADLRALDGCDGRVVAHVESDGRFVGFFERVQELARFLLPAYAEEGKAHLQIALGCTGGQHRSVAVAEKLAKSLAEDGCQVSIKHRELRIARVGESKA